MLAHTATMAEVLIGGVRVGRGTAMLDDLRAAGIVVPPADEDQPLRLAELRTTTGLKLPDCCVTDIALHHRATLATLDDTLAAAARKLGIPVIP